MNSNKLPFVFRSSRFFFFVMLTLASFGAGAVTAIPELLELDGSWQVRQGGTTEWIPAAVPGCIHTDLLAAKKIPDPFFRDNERLVQWVGETNWIYKRSFLASADFLKHERVLLHCDGLDTLATIRINGEEIGRADNMFRTWEFD